MKQSRNFCKIARGVINLPLTFRKLIPFCISLAAQCDAILFLTLCDTTLSKARVHNINCVRASCQEGHCLLIVYIYMKRVERPLTPRQSPIVSGGTYQPSAIKWKCARRRCAIRNHYRCNSATGAIALSRKKREDLEVN